MATDQNKRIFVSNDDPSEEIHIAKRPKIILDKVTKRKCLKAISAAFWVLMADHQLDVLDIHVSSQIANIIRSCFTVHRQESLGENAFKEKHANKAFTISKGGSTLDLNRAHTLDRVKQVFEWYGLAFTKPQANQKNHWYGTAAPYLSLCCAFEARLKEVRTGHQFFTKAKKDGKDHVARVSDFGFGPEHHILLEGVTYPPELASSLAQSLGALTICIRLCNESKTSKYGGKWKAAFSRAFAHVKECPEMCLALAGKSATEASVLLGPLADLALLVPPRTQRRACFPLNMLALVVLDDGERTHYRGTRTSSAYEPCKKAYEPMTEDTNAWDVNSFIVDGITMSGKGAFLLYHTALSFTVTVDDKTVPAHFKYPGSAAKKDAIQQGIFHAIWGTHLEDLSMLPMITTRNHDWMTRKEMGDFLVKTGSTAERVELSSMPRFTIYSKLCSANITKLLAESKGQVSSNPVFSGKRTQTYKEELLEMLRTRTSEPGGSTKDLISLAAIIRDKVGTLTSSIGDMGGRVEMGTVEWRKIADAGWEEGADGPICAEPTPLTGRFFLG